MIYRVATRNRKGGKKTGEDIIGKLIEGKKTFLVGRGIPSGTRWFVRVHS